MACNQDCFVLGGLVLVGALWALVHGLLCVRLFRAPALPRALRYAAWLPPITPVAAFAYGRRGLGGLWCVLALLYLVLRSMA
jgi:hypothetical protein